MTTLLNQFNSTIYGPVNSWRVGKSLGVDLLFTNSICSFRCIYCQLGKINEHTATRKIFVPTERVIADLLASQWQEADVITFSGNGEPTLALNLGEVMGEIKAITNKPVVVLTNSTLLHDSAVRSELAAADKIFCKLDAATDHTLKLIDRPVAGITVQTIVAGIKSLRQEYQGHLAIQTMLMPLNQHEVEALADLLKDIQPDEVQLNLPSRPVPREWSIESRGNHSRSEENAVKLKSLSAEDYKLIGERLQQLTRLHFTLASR